MRLVIDDHDALDPTSLPRVVKRAIAALDSLPDGKLLKRHGLARIIGVMPHTTKEHTAHPALADYKVRFQGSLLFGNPKTITEAREQLFA